METDWAALTMRTHARENGTRMTMDDILHLGNIITAGVRVGPIARSGDRHTISWGEHPGLWISPEQAVSLGFSSLEESQTSEGENSLSLTCESVVHNFFCTYTYVPGCSMNMM